MRRAVYKITHDNVSIFSRSRGDDEISRKKATSVKPCENIQSVQKLIFVFIVTRKDHEIPNRKVLNNVFLRTTVQELLEIISESQSETARDWTKLAHLIESSRRIDCAINSSISPEGCIRRQDEYPEN